jgi:hypothetical protein
VSGNTRVNARVSSFCGFSGGKKSSTQLREITTRRRGLVEQQHGTPNNKTGQTQLAKKKESQT